MKRLIIVLVSATVAVLPLLAREAAEGPPTPSPLTADEQALAFNPRFLHTDAQGRGLLIIDGEPLSPGRILTLSPWDLMEVVQTLAGVEEPLSRFGNGNTDALTQAWREKLAAFAEGASARVEHPQEDPFDPGLVLWDPGTIQYKNAWGQWTIRIENREIVQSDLATLSPLEVCQAVTVLTARTYPLEFVLAHLEAFRNQLSIVPRDPRPLATHR